MSTWSAMPTLSLLVYLVSRVFYIPYNRDNKFYCFHVDFTAASIIIIPQNVMIVIASPSDPQNLNHEIHQ